MAMGANALNPGAEKWNGPLTMSLEIEPLGIPDVKIIRPRKIEDSRGFFSETYNRKTFADAGITIDFVQDNHVVTRSVATIRGLHYQVPPFAQDKLVRVVKGRIFDVVVDLRRAVPTFGQWLAVELSAAAWNQILVPIGFAHGLCTLENNTEVIYKVSNFYSAKHDRGIRWSDPDLKIAWPFPEGMVHLSDRDRNQPLFSDIRDYF